MIDLYIDLDDTIFDFSRDFLSFVNESMKRDFKLPTKLEEWSSLQAFGLTTQMMGEYLKLYGKLGRVEIQPTMPGAEDFLDFIQSEDYVFPAPHFITVRSADVYIQTLRRLRLLYEGIGCFYPTSRFHLHMSYNKHQLKWKTIKELNNSAGQGIFIDDNPFYINDVVRECPGVITFWMNSLNLDTSLCGPHYTVTSLVQVSNIIQAYSLDFKSILSHSIRPGIQEELI